MSKQQPQQQPLTRAIVCAALFKSAAGRMQGMGKLMQGARNVWQTMNKPIAHMARPGAIPPKMQLPAGTPKPVPAAGAQPAAGGGGWGRTVGNWMTGVGIASVIPTIMGGGGGGQQPQQRPMPMGYPAQAANDPQNMDAYTPGYEQQGYYGYGSPLSTNALGSGIDMFNEPAPASVPTPMPRYDNVSELNPYMQQLLTNRT